MVHMSLVEQIWLDNSSILQLQAICCIVSHVLALEALHLTQVPWRTHNLTVLTIIAFIAISFPIAIAILVPIVVVVAIMVVTITPSMVVSIATMVIPPNSSMMVMTMIMSSIPI